MRRSGARHKMDRSGAHSIAADVVSRILERCIADGVMLDTLAQKFPPQDAMAILNEIRVISVELSIEASLNKAMENSRN
jgi:hypothetical protein